MLLEDGEACSTGAECLSGACVSGVCGSLLGLGEACSSGGECVSGSCVDGFCCDSSCSGACRACAGALTGGADGVCTPLPSGTSCGSGLVCDGNGTCQSVLLPLGAACSSASQCTSGNCRDGVCCNAPCSGLCESCNASGSCTAVPLNADPANECSGSLACDGQRGCQVCLPGSITVEACGSPCFDGTRTRTCNASGTDFTLGPCIGASPGPICP